jgi:hypothetical protein
VKLGVAKRLQPRALLARASLILVVLAAFALMLPRLGQSKPATVSPPAESRTQETASHGDIALDLPTLPAVAGARRAQFADLRGEPKRRFAAEGVAARLPAYSGGKTQGILDTGSSQIDLISGYKGPSANLPLGTPGTNGNIKSHVEARRSLDAAAGLSDATLYINRVPCAGLRGCDAMLPRMLPEGARLHVYGSNGFGHTYTGLPD